MMNEKSPHCRRSIRLRDYDYTQAGAYFITACVKNRECLLGDIVDGEMQRNPWGQIVTACWDDLPSHYPGMELDAFMVMPNHIHGIILLHDSNYAGAGFKPAAAAPINHQCLDLVLDPPRAGLKPAPTRMHGLPEIVRAFKTFSARRINQFWNKRGTSLWQRNYYEHIIRNDNELNLIRDYIINNPVQWELDRENPHRTGANPLDEWLYKEA